MNEENFTDSLSEGASQLFTRSHILSWANEVLKTSYSSLHCIPAHSTALILRSILLERKDLLFSSSACHGKASSSSPTSSVTDDTNRFLSLNGIQFLQSSSVPPLVELQNVKYLLQWIVEINQHFEALNVALTEAETFSAPVDHVKQDSSGALTPLSRSRSPSVVEPLAGRERAEISCASQRHIATSLPTISIAFSTDTLEGTAQHWVMGTAFVDTLKVWRWMMTLCHMWNLVPPQLSASMEDFLRRDRGSSAHVVGKGLPSSLEDGDAQLGQKRLRSSFGLCQEALVSASKGARGESRAGEEARVQQAAMGYDEALFNKVKETKTAFSLACVSQQNSESNVGGLSESKDTNVQAVDDVSLKTSLTTSDVHHGTNSVSWDIIASNEDFLNSNRLNSTCTETLTTALSCSRCSLVVAQAIEANKSSIEQLESIRLAAIQACLKKDSSALMAALSGVL